MAEVGITPVAGMNNVARDDDMVRGPDAPGRFVRDAVNVDIHADGAFSMRGAENQRPEAAGCVAEPFAWGCVLRA
ncbi:hypothetical protein ACGLUW_001392 [Neisseria gonorrhoeae]|uniref:hypothetical protein n=1 Tax=Neisseria gonorrhoeae TaxID=485 RepID=UPI0021A6B0C2|nr:hypothetical protein [Neisseria gonorrhoeae]